MILSAMSGFLCMSLVMWLLGSASVAMEFEIIAGLGALVAGYLAIHAATLKLVPRDDDISLKL